MRFSQPAKKRIPSMCQSTRRDFVRRSLLGSLVCSVSERFAGLVSAQVAETPRYDLLIKDGKVVDPAQKLSAVRDVAIAGGKVVRLSENIPATEARQVFDAAGKIVTPGLIDVHVHVYDGVTSYGLPVDVNCIAKGVTSVLDAGSAGAH